MNSLFTVARYTLFEGIRARFVVAAVVISVLLVAAGVVIGSVPYGRTDEVILRIGWGVIFLTAFAMSLFFSIQLLAREREQRVLHLMLAKPLSRDAYALGKFVGLFGLTTAAVLLEGAILAAFVAWFGQFGIDPWRVWLDPALTTLLKCGALLAGAMLLQSLMSPVLAMLAVFAWYLLGVGGHDMVLLAQKTDSEWIIRGAKALRWTAPRFGEFDGALWATYGIDVAGWVRAGAILHFGGYTLLALLAYLVVFSRREVL